MYRRTITKQPEVWLRGAIEGIPALLQPVVHALRQAQEEIHELMDHFPSECLWQKPGGVASPGFHLQHMTGVLDRMLSYAKGNSLTECQFDYLKQEGIPDTNITNVMLLDRFDRKIEEFIAYAATVEEAQLREARTVGRAKLPSTVLGLLFHAAEHTQRHCGQLLVTVRVLISSRS